MYSRRAGRLRCPLRACRSRQPAHGHGPSHRRSSNSARRGRRGTSCRGGRWRRRAPLLERQNACTDAAGPPRHARDDASRAHNQASSSRRNSRMTFPMRWCPCVRPASGSTPDGTGRPRPAASRARPPSPRRHRLSAVTTSSCRHLLRIANSEWYRPAVNSSGMPSNSPPVPWRTWIALGLPCIGTSSTPSCRRRARRSPAGRDRRRRPAARGRSRASPFPARRSPPACPGRVTARRDPERSHRASPGSNPDRPEQRSRPRPPSGGSSPRACARTSPGGRRAGRACRRRPARRAALRRRRSGSRTADRVEERRRLHRASPLPPQRGSES